MNEAMRIKLAIVRTIEGRNEHGDKDLLQKLCTEYDIVRRDGLDALLTSLQTMMG